MPLAVPPHIAPSLTSAVEAGSGEFKRLARCVVGDYEYSSDSRTVRNVGNRRPWNVC